MHYSDVVKLNAKLARRLRFHFSHLFPTEYRIIIRWKNLKILDLKLVADWMLRSAMPLKKFNFSNFFYIAFRRSFASFADAA